MNNEIYNIQVDRCICDPTIETNNESFIELKATNKITKVSYIVKLFDTNIKKITSGGGLICNTNEFYLLLESLFIKNNSEFKINYSITNNKMTMIFFLKISSIGKNISYKIELDEINNDNRINDMIIDFHNEIMNNTIIIQQMQDDLIKYKQEVNNTLKKNKRDIGMLLIKKKSKEKMENNNTRYNEE